MAARGILLRVRGKPGAREDRVVGVRGEELVVSTRAAPERGKATEAIARTIADALGLRRDEVALEHGASTPRKVFALPGRALGALEAMLQELERGHA
jgi:uncharacterized protein YggU (UPF0235/DUF167 family)